MQLESVTNPPPKCLKFGLRKWDDNPFKQILGEYVQDWPNLIVLDTMHAIYSG